MAIYCLIRVVVLFICHHLFVALLSFILRSLLDFEFWILDPCFEDYLNNMNVENLKKID